MPAANWEWYLAQPIYNTDGSFNSFERLGLMDGIHGRKITPALNASESAGFSMHLLDPLASLVVPIQTCVVAYRNGALRWSGPVWTLDENAGEGQNTMAVTCTGWFTLLKYRILRCGALGAGAPITGLPLYGGVGPTATMTATSHTYNMVDPSAIAQDLLLRTNFEYPTGITLGNFPANPNSIQWNQTYQVYQNIGTAIQTLANLESGFDFRVDPATLQFNTYYNRVKSTLGVYGRGQDRPNAVFGYKWGPENLKQLRRTTDPSQIANMFVSLGQYGAGLVPVPASILQNGLFEVQQSLSDVVSQTILDAYAAAEAFIRAYPMQIYSFSPMAVHSSEAGNVPQPFDDYDVGDMVYLGANYGRLQLPQGGGTSGQVVRIYGFEVDIDDEGNETVSNVQTTYQTQS